MSEKVSFSSPAVTFTTPSKLRASNACLINATSTAVRRLDSGDIDLLHFHHRIEGALGGSGIGVSYCFGERHGRDLPGEAPFVLAPTARTLLPAVADDCVPVTIGFGLVGGCDLKRECLVVLESRSAIEPEAGDSHDGKLDRQHIPFLPG